MSVRVAWAAIAWGRPIVPDENCRGNNFPEGNYLGEFSGGNYPWGKS